MLVVMGVNDPDPIGSMRKLNQTLIISSISVSAAIIAIIASLYFTHIVSDNSSQVTWLALATTIITTVIALGFGTFQLFDKAKEVHTQKPEEKQPPLKITLEIDGEPITVETTDVKRAAEILKLVRDLQTKPSSNN